MTESNSLRVFAISDIHSEFYNSAVDAFAVIKDKLPAADVLVLAGDIGKPSEKLSDLLKLFKSRYLEIVYVAGNHEYYDAFPAGNRADEQIKLRKICSEIGVHFLEKESIIIRDREFVGATLWSAINESTASQMADFRDAFVDRFDYLGEFIDAYRWLKVKLATALPQGVVKRVVVTHHLPSRVLIHNAFVDSPSNSGFASHILPTLDIRNVSAWICGHSHEFKTRKAGDTLLWLNPVGYPDEKRCTKVSYETLFV